MKKLKKPKAKLQALKQQYIAMRTDDAEAAKYKLKRALDFTRFEKLRK